MQKIQKTPKGKLFYKRYVENFDPYNPSEVLVEKLNKEVVPNSSYITKNMRGISFNELTIDGASYIGYEAKMGTEDKRLLAKLKYFIELAKDETIEKEEIEELLFDKEVGLKNSKEPDVNNYVVNNDGIKKPQIF